jgi:hypothetical protein
MPARDEPVNVDDWRRKLNHELEPLLDSKVPTSIICCGSPRACPAAELMLADILGGTPFARPPAPGPRPFAYVWSDQALRANPSSFAVTASLSDEVRQRHGQGPVQAMQIRGQLLPLNQQEDTWTTYGVCVARRFENEAVWLVLGGATGPGTLACAREVEAMEADWSGRDGDSAVRGAWMAVWGDVRRTIDADEVKRPGDRRRLVRSGVYVDEANDVAPVNLLTSGQ